MSKNTALPFTAARRTTLFRDVDMDMGDLRQVINGFSFDRCKNGSQGFKQILIQLFGMIGNGKSSFINTCIYVWQDDEYQNWAKEGIDFGASTTERLEYKLTSNITLVVNRGLVTMDGYETGEIFAQLGNLLPLGIEVEWCKGFELVNIIFKSEELVKDSDFIVPVYVHSVRKTITPNEMNDLRSILLNARKLTGIFPIVVLTHKTSGNLTSVESSFKALGVERIFAFENYTTEDHFKTRGRHEEVLKFLQEVIKDAQFRVEHQTRNPMKEMQERKTFVMNYVHDHAKKMEEENLERQEALERVRKRKELQKQEEELERERERRRQALEEELRKTREMFERQRLVDQARFEEELQQGIRFKKGRKGFKLFGKKK